jgi:hypothetical protein
VLHFNTTNNNNPIFSAQLLHPHPHPPLSIYNLTSLTNSLEYDLFAFHQCNGFPSYIRPAVPRAYIRSPAVAPTSFPPVRYKHPPLSLHTLNTAPFYLLKTPGPAEPHTNTQFGPHRKHHAYRSVDAVGRARCCRMLSHVILYVLLGLQLLFAAESYIVGLKYRRDGRFRVAGMYRVIQSKPGYRG